MTVEQAIVVLFLLFFSLELLVEFLLNELNLRYVLKNSSAGDVPGVFRGRMNREVYQKSADYTVAKGRFQRAATLYGAVITLTILFSGLLPYLDGLAAAVGEVSSSTLKTQGVVFCLAVAVIAAVLAFPIELYAIFSIEERFGFNRTSLRLYFADKLRGLLLSLVIGAPFLFGVLHLMDETGRFWWLWAFLFVTAFQVVMVVLYPTFIAPLFNKFTPIEEGELRERILALAEKVGFKTSGIYTMDGSKRSSHSNAYFTGIGQSKRIVLFDTLLAKMTPPEALAVLSHEMGHYRLKHVRTTLAVNTIFLLIGFYVLSWFVDYKPLFAAFGLAPSSHAALVLASFLAGPLTFYLHPLFNMLSRRHEYEADRFAAETMEAKDPLERALVKLTVENLANLTPHPWYSAYHYSHPSPTERISAIRAESGGSDQNRVAARP